MSKRPTAMIVIMIRVVSFRLVSNAVIDLEHVERRNKHQEVYEKTENDRREKNGPGICGMLG